MTLFNLTDLHVIAITDAVELLNGNREMIANPIISAALITNIVYIVLEE